MSATAKLSSVKFEDNFWESTENNGIATLIERMRGAKQTCERYKHAYEARALLEEEYGKTLLQIAQKQKASSVENGSSKAAMDTMQNEFLSVAESHLQLATHLKENVTNPLATLLNKQKILRKELQSSIQKLFNNRQLQVHFVRRAHKRHNLEIEKANLLVQQQTTENDKRATFKMAEVTIDKLKKVYDEALRDLEKITEEWNVEWKKTCKGFEELEQERLEFFKSNLSNYANLMIGCLENEVQAYERVSTEATKVDVAHDLAEFVEKNKSSPIVPTPMDYVKLHAYQEANQERGDLKHTHNILRDSIDTEDHSESEDKVRVHLHRKRASISSVTSEGTSTISRATLLKSAATEAKKHTPAEEAIKPATPVELPPPSEPVMMMGVMEVYPSDEEDDTDEEYEYVTETESEDEQAPKHDDDEEKVKEEDYEEDEEDEQVEEIHVKHENKTGDSNTQLQDKEDKVKATQVLSQDTPSTIANQEDIMEQHIQSGQSTPQDEKVDRLMSAYQEIRKEQQTPPSLLARHAANTQRRVSFVGDEIDFPKAKPTVSLSNSNSTRIVDPTTTLHRLNSSNTTTIPTYSKKSTTPTQEEPEDYEDNSESAALELDDMLRELDSKRIIRNGEESTRYRRPDIKPTASTSSPSLLQRQQQERQGIPSQYYHQQQPSYLSSRRMSSVEASRPQYAQAPSMRSTSGSYMDLYDPFNSLSSRETGTMSTRSGSLENGAKTTPPTAQMIHERMMSQTRDRRASYHGSASSSSSSNGSVRSIGQQGYSNEKFIEDYYSVNSKSSSPNHTISSKPKESEGHFIDFAFALYDYEAADEGEIGFKEGDLLGIISKNEDDEQGWWEASLLSRKNQKIVRTGLVPSNFLETASSSK